MDGKVVVNNAGILRDRIFFSGGRLSMKPIIDTRARRQLLVSLALTAAGVSLMPLPARAQSAASASGPIKLVVGYSAGGPVDSAARLFAPALQRELGVPVVVENRPGASGSLGGDAVAKAVPDGNTLFFAGSPTIVINPNVQRHMAFDPMKDLVPIAPLVTYANVLIVNKDLPPRNVTELIAYAKATPGRVTYGSAGVGASNHLSGALLEKMSSTQMTHVPYKGNAPAMTDLIGGQVSMMFDVIANARPFVGSGKVRALAVTSRKRNPMLPDVPTMIEAGVAGFDVDGWFALYGPAALPKPMVASLNAATRKVLAREDVRTRLSEMGYELWEGGDDMLASKARADRVMWATVSKGVEVD
jgi:tripartite-type tricarboxylate transporter receptor subunit TctC